MFGGTFTIPPRAPNLNPYSESWISRTKAECLDHFIVFGKAHLRHIIKSWLTHYHSQRPHQGLGNVPIMADLPPPAPIGQLDLDDIVCHESLGGLLKHYERRHGVTVGENGLFHWAPLLAYRSLVFVRRVIVHTLGVMKGLIDGRDVLRQRR